MKDNHTKLIMFDMDGLLIDSEKHMWLKNGMKAAEYYGYKPDPEYYKSLMGMAKNIYYEKLVAYYGDSFPVPKISKKVDELNDATIKNNEIPLMKGVEELLHFLKENDIKMTVVTSSPIPMAKKILNNLEVLDYFDSIHSGTEVKRGKPYPDIYLKVLNDYGYKKEETIIFEDSHNGARAAIAADIKLILVPNVAYVSSEDKKEAYKVIKTIDQGIDIIKELNKIQ